VTSYFSGHYQCYGVNVQAACNAKCHFTYLSVQCPRSTGDSKAFFGSSLHNFIGSLPTGFFIVADNAYMLSDHLLIPYSGQDKRDTQKDVYNFFLSQLQIRIEQSFGILVNKWRVFKKPMKLKFFHITHLIECCFWLHNFCLDCGDTRVTKVMNHDPETHLLAYEEGLNSPQEDTQGT